MKTQKKQRITSYFGLAVAAFLALSLGSLGVACNSDSDGIVDTSTPRKQVRQTQTSASHRYFSYCSQ